jgi:hypothetical protein
VNGSVRELSDFRKYSSYVRQDDFLFGSMTPREVLTLSVKLRTDGLTESEQTRLVSVNPKHCLYCVMCIVLAWFCDQDVTVAFITYACMSDL